MNRVILTGRLTSDPNYSESGETKTARICVAVDRKYSKGEEKTDFINCVAFNKKAEFLNKYFKKGMKINLEGEWRTGKYTNKDGVIVYTNDCLITEIEFGESKGSNPIANEGSSSAETSSEDFIQIPEGMIDDLPFN